MSCPFELKTKIIRLKKNTPLDVVEFLRKCLECSYPEPLSEHEFFKTERWRSVFSHMGYSWYEKPFFNELPSGLGYELFLHADINYGSDEIHEFVNWITPYVCGHKPKEYIGKYRRDGMGYKKYANLYVERSGLAELPCIKPIDMKNVIPLKDYSEEMLKLSMIPKEFFGK